MRVILAIVALGALGWTGWWFAVASAKEAAITAWLDERRASGWVAEASAIDVEGFPYRVDTTVRGLELANPDAGWAWSAPQFQFLTLAYQPNHLIAIWPDAQTIATVFGATDVRSETMRGSLVVEPDTRLTLRRTAIEIVGLGLTLPVGGVIGIESAMLTTRQAEGPAAAPFAHEMAFTAETLSLPDDLLRGVDPTGVLSPVIETARFDVLATFDGPWDRPAIEGVPPALDALEIRDMTLTWGSLDLRGKGALTAGADGYAVGRIDLRARNWREMIDLAERAGAVSSGVAGTMRGGLGLLARLAGDGETLEAPLDFADGRVFLGPVPIGRAPRMASR